MGSKNSIKSILLTLYKEEKTEDEAYNQIVESHSSKSVSKKTVNKWYQRFNSGDLSLDNSAKVTIKNKLSDEYLVNLIKDNPNHTISELARLAGASFSALQIRINKLNSCNEKIYKIKDVKKVSDEFIIDLVNNNPTLNMAELAKLANISSRALSARIKHINRDGEKVNYVKKKRGAKPNEKSVQKFTDEYLIDLVNENPNLTMIELADLAGVVVSTISSRIKKINKLSKKVNYRNKDNIKITDEEIMELVDENPDLNMDELAIRSGVTSDTISRRIKQLNSKGKPVNYFRERFETKTKTMVTDKFLIDLINQNPDLNKKEMAKLANISYDTLLRRIKQINSIKESEIISTKDIESIS